MTVVPLADLANRTNPQPHSSSPFPTKVKMKKVNSDSKSIAVVVVVAAAVVPSWNAKTTKTTIAYTTHQLDPTHSHSHSYPCTDRVVVVDAP